MRNNIRKQVSKKAGKSKSSASGRITRSVIEHQGTQFKDMVAGGTDNPFATFVEWAGLADEKAYANL